MKEIDFPSQAPQCIQHCLSKRFEHPQTNHGTTLQEMCALPGISGTPRSPPPLDVLPGGPRSVYQDDLVQVNSR